MAYALGLLAVSLALLFVLDDTWFQLLHAIYLAFVFVQISLLAHDFGHRQFSFRAPRKNDWLTLVFPRSCSPSEVHIASPAIHLTKAVCLSAPLCAFDSFDYFTLLFLIIVYKA